MNDQTTDSTKPAADADADSEADAPKAFLGLNRKRRFQIYGWLAVALVLGAATWTYAYLEPHRWYKYTDVVSLEQVARDVEVGYVLWKDAERVEAGVLPADIVSEPTLSSDGTRMVYAKIGKDKTMDLFLRIWNGTTWSSPKSMRALSSNFEETSPSMSGDGRFLYFASNRPGGRGGYDIWVAKWDGAEFAWPLPLTNRVNTPFDELGPAIAPDNYELFFSSNRPRQRVDETKVKLTKQKIEELKTDHDLFSADLASETPYELMIERQLSMLYSLREGALNDMKVMVKLGGTEQTETAVDKALAYLAKTQSEDGRWDLGKDGGSAKHTMAATGFALLAFYGRGERHDQPCQYQEVVKKGINWMIEQQGKADGDLRGYDKVKGDMYDHGIAALAMVEAYGVTKDLKLRPRAQSAVDFIEESQNPEVGGWRYQPRPKDCDLSVSGWMVMVLASAQMSGLQVKDETIQGARKFLKSVSGGDHGGAFGYTVGKVGKGGKSPAMNAVGFFCSQLLGLSSNSELAWEASGNIDKKGLDVKDLYYAYYGTLASYQHQGPAWRKWLGEMRKKFVAAQAEDGSWRAAGSHGNQMGTIVATALISLCLEAHYRYTPLYGLGFEPDPAGPAKGDTLLTGDQLPPTPLFRHAKHLEILASPADDIDPVVTEHNDFLYFASGRENGQGGTDIYRSRFIRKLVDIDDGRERLVPDVPQNLGPEINSEADEAAPALRMAGFNLMYNSSRGENPDALYGAMSKRVVRRYDYSKMPDGAWMSDNIGWLLGMGGAALMLAFGSWFAIRKPSVSGDEIEVSEPVEAAA
jgi:hypothetical protein